MGDMPLTASNSVAIATVPASSVMVSMDSDGGHIKIDWSEVEKQAEGSDKILRPVAKALLAVRDKTWEPIK